MKVSKHRAGEYIVTLHDRSFTLEKVAEDTCWRLYNTRGVELAQAETKSGMLQVIGQWSEQRAHDEASQTQSAGW